jgi:hypothetical protein
LWVAALLAIWRDRSNTQDPDKFWRGGFLVAWALLPIVFTALISLHNPVFVQRYMIFGLPATIMLAGYGMTALSRHHLGLWLVLLLCASSIVNIFVGYRKPRENWRDATAAVLAAARPGDGVVIYPNFARPGFDYYYDIHRNSAPAVRTFARFYDSGEDDNDLSRVLDSNPRTLEHVWVMMRDEVGSENNLAAYSPNVAAKLQSLYGAPRTQKFQGITVLEFGK